MTEDSHLNLPKRIHVIWTDVPDCVYKPRMKWRFNNHQEWYNHILKLQKPKYTPPESVWPFLKASQRPRI